jgi:anti-anti-sigma factor
MLTINVERVKEVVVLRCSGRIVHGHETALLCSAMQQESRNVVLDLTEVDAIDAAGVGALLSLQAAGVYLKLRNPSRQVREILKVTRLNSIFEICESQSIAETKKPHFGARLRCFATRLNNGAPQLPAASTAPKRIMASMLARPSRDQ